jgi:hypothetical protein
LAVLVAVAESTKANIGLGCCAMQKTKLGEEKELLRKEVLPKKNLLGWKKVVE